MTALTVVGLLLAGAAAGVAGTVLSVELVWRRSRARRRAVASGVAARASSGGHDAP